MKKIFAAALILALFLSGCGFTEQLETVKEEYIDPAIERAQSGEAVAIENTAVAAPNVNTNRERLTDYVPFAARSLRRSSPRRITAGCCPLRAGW